jgi:hypothetical protein
MADGEIILRLDPETEHLLKKAAESEGVTPEELGARLIADGMIDHLGWPDDVAAGLVNPDPEIDRQIARETLERGDGIPLEEFIKRFDNFGQKVR